MSENKSDEAKEHKGHNWKLYLNIFTFIALVLLIYSVREQIVDTFSNLKNLHAGWLLTMILWQLLNYHVYSEMYRDLFKTLGTKIEYWPMYKASVELNFVNNVFPSAGVAGFSYFSYRLKQEGAPASKSTLVQMMRFATIFVSFQLLLFLGVVILALDGKANNFTILVAGSLGTLLAVGTVVVTYIAGNRRRIDAFTVGLTKMLNKGIHWLRPSYPETIKIDWVRKLFIDLHKDYMILRKDIRALKKPIFYATMANITELLTVYVVFLAFGEAVNPGAVIIAYAVANFAGLISVLPGGIGIYEALMAGVLAAAGVPLAVAIPVTVTYRILSMAIQLPPGYYLYQIALKDMGNGKKLKMG